MVIGFSLLAFPDATLFSPMRLLSAFLTARSVILFEQRCLSLEAAILLSVNRPDISLCVLSKHCYSNLSENVCPGTHRHRRAVSICQ